MSFFIIKHVLQIKWSWLLDILIKKKPIEISLGFMAVQKIQTVVLK